MQPMVFPADLDALEPVRELVTRVARQGKLENRAIYRLCLAVDEILTNIVVHGYQEAGTQGEVRVWAEASDDMVRVTLEDEGAAFDPRERPQPPRSLSLPLEEREPGGLGVYLAIREVDEYRYHREGATNHNLFIMYRVDEVRLAHDLTHVVLPIGMALSGERDFDRLLERILTAAKTVCHADGGTLYLRDGEALRFAIMLTDSLGIAAGGTSGKPIDLPPVPLVDRHGKPNLCAVAAHAAILGQSVNIRDIYEAVGFDFSGTRAFDERNGYRSTSTLTVPLKNHDKQVIGVLQLLNAKNPHTGEIGPFTAYLQQLVEALASQAAVVLNNRILLESQKDLARFEKELQIGRQIQMSFLPESLPVLPGWQLAAECRPAREVGGDFYDFIPSTATDRLALIIADVCDKGVGAALFMALIRSLVRAFFEMGECRLGSAAEPLERSNQYLLAHHAQTTMFATAFYAVLEPTTGELLYVNAGHNEPFVIGPEGIKTRLGRSGPGIGMFPDVTFTPRRLVLAPGDALFCYTDGLTEARSTSGAFFTEAALERAVVPPPPGAEALLTQAVAAVRAHIGDAPQYDDMTTLVLYRQPIS